MEDNSPQPKVFANKVIQMMIQHSFADEFEIRPEDYQAIRVVFRSCGGSWEKFVQGHQVHTELLKAIVQGWGNMPNRPSTSDQLV